ncbi:hypothetical protein TNCV_4968541 [Trichonephila clavipes]|nr:hypothetical protein TNCV_4968541 [Trichonephila clavipes]
MEHILETDVSSMHPPQMSPLNHGSFWSTGMVVSTEGCLHGLPSDKRLNTGTYMTHPSRKSIRLILPKANLSYSQSPKTALHGQRVYNTNDIIEQTEE